MPFQAGCYASSRALGVVDSLGLGLADTSGGPSTGAAALAECNWEQVRGNAWALAVQVIDKCVPLALQLYDLHRQEMTLVKQEANETPLEQERTGRAVAALGDRIYPLYLQFVGCAGAASHTIDCAYERKGHFSMPGPGQTCPPAPPLRLYQTEAEDPYESGNPPPHPPPPSPNPQQADQFRNQMLLYAQAILQDAGRVSKEMTDAMDVTKHNNVGINVALTSYLGAAGKMMGLVASEFQAAAGAATAAQEEGAVLQIASGAVSESGGVATQGGEAVAQAEAAGAAGMGANGSSLGYLEGTISYGGGNMPRVVQGALPTCAVLSCHRLADLIGRNKPVFEVFDTIFEKIVPHATYKLTVQITKTGEVVLGGGGLTAPEVKAALQAIGINAEVGTGMPSLLNEVGAGRPVIAGVYSMGPNAGPLHAVVIEGIVQRGGQFGLKIYDPIGDVYWQPVSTFGKYFTGEFVWPQ